MIKSSLANGLNMIRVGRQGENVTDYNVAVQWIVQDADTLGGQARIKNTRLSAAFILECLAQGMSPEDIARDYPGFPPAAVPEVLHFASQVVAQEQALAS